MEIKNVKVHFYSDLGEIITRNHDVVFPVYEKNGKFGIDWNTNHAPYINSGDVFVPLENFSHTVIFEDVDSGKSYCYDPLTDYIRQVK